MDHSTAGWIDPDHERLFRALRGCAQATAFDAWEVRTDWVDDPEVEEVLAAAGWSVRAPRRREGWFGSSSHGALTAVIDSDTDAVVDAVRAALRQPLLDSLSAVQRVPTPGAIKIEYSPGHPPDISWDDQAWPDGMSVLQTCVGVGVPRRDGQRIVVAVG
jgi:hypothetical protein